MEWKCDVMNVKGDAKNVDVAGQGNSADADAAAADRVPRARRAARAARSPGDDRPAPLRLTYSK